MLILQNFSPTPDDGYIIDVGCHVGSFSLSIAKQGYNVISIDGCGQSMECLSEGVKRNKLSNILLKHAVVSSKNRPCRFSQTTNSGSIVYFNEDDKQSQQLQTLTIDDIVDGKKCSLIKLDIEGHEKDAIEGSIETIEHNYPVLIIEVNNHLLTSPKTIFSQLNTLSYDIFLCNTDMHLQPIRPTDIFPYCVIDVLCLHKSYDKSNLTIKDIFTNKDIRQRLMNPEVQMYNMNSPCYNYFNSVFKELP